MSADGASSQNEPLAGQVIAMKPFIFAVVLAIGQASSPVPAGRTTNSAARTSSEVKRESAAKRRPANQSPPTVEQNETPTAKRDAQQEGGNNAEHAVGISKLPPVSITREWPDWGLWVFSFLLVVVGFLQVWLLHRTFGAIQRQANNMEEQTGILKDSVKAANDSAKAAQDNIDLFINKERARLRVHVKNFELRQESGVNITLDTPPEPIQMFRDIQAHVVSYEVSFYGPTPAFVLESRAIAKLRELKEPVIDYRKEEGLYMYLPEIIDSGTTLETLHALLLPKVILEESDIERIQKGALFVHFYGFIKYNDAFEKSRTTSFHLRWEVGDPILGANGRWVKCGPPEANHST
jgi:hypothetical protein